MSVWRVKRSELDGKLTFIAEGNFGRVYRTTYRLPRDPTELAYKEYTDPPLAGGPAKTGEAADKAVKFRDAKLLAGDKATIDDLNTFFAWPREIVVDDATDKIVGFLMPMVQSAYIWRQGRHADEPRTLDWLASSQRVCQANQVDLSTVTVIDRLYLMVQLSYAIGWLHKQGWVFGDLSFKNVTFAMYPPDPPKLLLLDCDDAAMLADPQRELQPHTPWWVPPECRGQKLQQNAATDVYKLGLAIVRCLKPGPNSGQHTMQTEDVSRIADLLDSRSLDLVNAALDPDPGKRPDAMKLFSHLKEITAPQMIPPEMAHTELISPLVPTGGNARIDWLITGAEEINVFLGENTQDQNKVLTVTPADPPDGCAFPITRSGQVIVQAMNRYGVVTRIVGDVSVFEIPPFSFDPATLPPPGIPPLEHTQAPLPPLTIGDLTVPDIPPPPQPEFPDVLNDPAPGKGRRSLLDSLHAEAERRTAKLRCKNKRNSRG